MLNENHGLDHFVLQSYDVFCYAVLFCSLVYPLGNAYICATPLPGWLIVLETSLLPEEWGNARQRWNQYPGELQAGAGPAHHQPVLAVLCLLMVVILFKNL